MTLPSQSAIRNPKSAIAVALSILAILVATLHSGGGSLAHGWSYSLTSGEAALAELIENLMLFIPLGISLILTGVRPSRAIALGALLSFAVEFTQQWIPGRDPSTGDIICNTASTAIGVALAHFAPRWLITPPGRSAWQALAAAVLAVLVWIGTGAAVRPQFPAGPEKEVRALRLARWGEYQGRILWTSFEHGALAVVAVAPPRPPSRASPLDVIVDSRGRNIVILAVDGSDLSLSYYMLAVELTLEQPDLRWRGALAAIAPGDTFTVKTGHDEDGICMGVNRASRCGFGYTVGDGWKLIYYPERFPGWVLTTINALWIAGCVIGVGWWARRCSGGEGAARGRRWAARAAVGTVLVALVIVPWLTGLNGTTLWEWIGALGGIELGLVLGATGPARSYTPRHSAS
jgi:hypothetical protein